MKRARSQILTFTSLDNKEYSMSIAEKQSDTGIAYNQRLFVLISGVKFGYFSTFKQNYDPREADPSKLKAEGLVKYIQSCTQNGRMLQINFWIRNDKTKKKQSKKWIFRFITEQIAKEWASKLNYQKELSDFKKSTHSPKSSNHLSRQKLHPFRSDFSKHPKKAEEAEDRNAKTASEFHELGRFKSNSQKPLSHLSPYQEAIIEKSDEDPIDEKKKEKEIQKIKEENAEKQKKSKLEQKILLLQRLQKEKQQRQRQEAQILLRNKEVEGWRKKEENRKMEIANDQQQNTNQLFLQQNKILQRGNQIQEQKKREQSKEDKPIKKQPHFDNPIFLEQRINNFDRVEPEKNKPKLKGVEYYEIISRIIGSANEPSECESKREVEKPQNYIFELDKIKMEKPSFDRERIINNRSGVKMSYSQGWMFKFLMKLSDGEEYEVIHEFEQFCKNKLRQIVEQFRIPEKKRKILPNYKGKDCLHYQLDDIEVKVAIFDIKQTFNEEEQDKKDRICDLSSSKKLSNQFKNYRSLYKAIQNSGFIRIPLVCLCEYRGFISLFKTTAQFDRQGIPSSQYDRNVENCLEQISERSKVDLQVLRSRDNATILKIDSHYYHEMALEAGKGHLDFDYYIIQEIKYLMPPDLLYHPKNNYQFISKMSQHQTYLREELLQICSEQKEHVNLITSEKQRHQKISSQKDHLYQKLSQNIASAIQQLQDLDFYFMNPKEIQAFLHQRGINMRYLGHIYQNISLPFSKNWIISQIAARSCKAIFCKTIHQKFFRENRNRQEQDKLRQDIFDSEVDFLNCIVGNRRETAAFWKIISNHSFQYFNIKVNKDKIEKGYFIISLTYHCGIKVNWSKVNINEVFQTQSFFTRQNLNGNFFKAKSLPPLFKQTQKNLMNRIIKFDRQVFVEFIQQFSLESKEIPFSVINSTEYSQVRQYLTSFIPPDNLLKTHERKFSHLNLYEYKGCPTRRQIDLQIKELKWYLRKGKKQKYFLKFNDLISKIKVFFGDFHPLISSIYETMSSYYKTSYEYEDSKTFSKSSLVNMLKICGINHLKVGQCYFQLALCFIKSGDKEQAILNLKKAKNIFEKNKKIDSTGYALLTLKLGLLFLSQSKVKECQKIVLYSIQTLQKKCQYEEQFQDEIVQGYELLARCYEIMEAEKQLKDLGNQASKRLVSTKQPGNFQKILKIALYPLLSSLPAQKASTFLDLIPQIPINIESDTYIRSYKFIQKRAAQKYFLDDFSHCLNNIEHFDNYISENDILKTWETLREVNQKESVYEFISVVENMLYFMGEGWVVGALRESLL